LDAGRFVELERDGIDALIGDLGRQARARRAGA
jgi:hypothetical protein